MGPLPSSALLIFLVLLAVHWFALDARFSVPRTSNSYTKYPMSFGMKFLFSCSVPLLVYGAIANFYSKAGETWVSILLLSIAAFCAYNMPPTILCSQDRVISVQWYGAKKTSVEWSDVISVWRNPEDDSITITGKSGERIIYTRFNVGRAQFLNQISDLPFRFARMV